MMDRRQGHFGLARFRLHAGLAILAPIVFCLLLGEAQAQSKAGNASYLKAGIKSLADGKPDLAIKQISQAITSGKLSEKEVAKALFKRGQAYRTSGKHALAIADLTNALYLKALTDKDKDVAHLERARAFTALGMTSRSSADIQAASRATTPGNQVSTPASKAPTQAVAFRGTTVPTETGTTVATATVVTSQPAHTAAVVNTPKKPTLTTDPVGSISNFFQSFIPGSDNKLSAKPQIQQTASITQPQPATQNKPVWQAKEQAAQKLPASASTSTSQNRPVWMAPDAAQPNQAPSAGWSGSTQVSASPVRTAALAPAPIKAVAANTPPPPIRKSTPPVAPVVVGKVMPLRKPPAKTLTPTPIAKPVTRAAPPAPAKRFHLQLAAVSSQAEANQVWQQLSNQHANLLSGLTPTIKKTTEAGKGTYFHVGLGPFSTKSSTGRICDSFKQQGLNCSVVKH